MKTLISILAFLIFVANLDASLYFSHLPTVVDANTARIGVSMLHQNEDGTIYRERGYLYGPYDGVSIRYEQDDVSSSLYTLETLGISQETFDLIEGKMLYPAVKWDQFSEPSYSYNWATSYFYSSDYYSFNQTVYYSTFLTAHSVYVLNPVGYEEQGLVPNFGFTTPDTVPYQQIPLYRFARKDVYAHFFTAGKAEKEGIIDNLAASFEFEGVSHYVVANYTLNSQPVYRLYNKLSGAHFYTATKAEVESVLTNMGDIFSLEGIAFFVFAFPEEGTVPVYRFFAPQTASHFFTASEAEKNTIISSVSTDILRYEGVAWYAYPAN